MKAMILAAGRGARMRPLTDSTPKPLLEVHGKPLIVYHIENCVAAGISDIVINHAWLGEKIEAVLGDGSQFGANIEYSPEIAGGLETAGGVVQALPLLGDKPFLLLSADVWTDMKYAALPVLDRAWAHLVLVNNPAHHRQGDFGLDGYGRLTQGGDDCFTYSGIGVFQAKLFEGLSAGRLALRPVLEAAIKAQKLSGHVYQGVWSDVGTPERLASLQTQ